MFGADRDRQPAIEDVAHQGDHHELLLQRAQHTANRVDRVERLRHGRRPADEHRLVGPVRLDRGQGDRTQRIDCCVAAHRTFDRRADRLADRDRGQAGTDCGEHRVGGIDREFEVGILHRPVGQHCHHRGVTARQPDDLQRTNRGLIPARPHHDGGIRGDLGEQVAGLVQQLLEAAVRGGEELSDALRRRPIEVPGRGHVVHVEPVALVGRHPAGGGVRLGDVTLLLQHGHLVAHRGRADVHPRRLGDMRRPHRLRGGDVLLDDRSQDRGLALVEHGAPWLGGRIGWIRWGGSGERAGSLSRRLRVRISTGSVAAAGEPFRTSTPRSGPTPRAAPRRDRPSAADSRRGVRQQERGCSDRRCHPVPAAIRGCSVRRGRTSRTG